ncbi:hypothetical protein ANO11243_027810 [Dothideomycetidae sp. 11243]|nr:hypothetical protein ANO11243_027810 [fungal sp. No.11243]
MSTSTPPQPSTQTYNSQPYTPRHKTWPYKPSDFSRHDSSPDTSFYGPARFVTHIDDAAIASLQTYYATALPVKGRILDFCSSWISHYPPSVTAAASNGALQIIGTGMNAAELQRNEVLNAGRLVRDLNATPSIPPEVATGGTLDAATCVVSIDYLTQPVEVLQSLRGMMKLDGMVHLVVSNRCFPTKAVARWLRVSEQERLLMVADYLHFAGWTGIEILDLKAGERTDDQGGDAQRGFKELMRSFGMGADDPLWVVRGRNPG